MSTEKSMSRPDHSDPMWGSVAETRLAAAIAVDAVIATEAGGNMSPAKATGTTSRLRSGLLTLPSSAVADAMTMHVATDHASEKLTRQVLAAWMGTTTKRLTIPSATHDDAMIQMARRCAPCGVAARYPMTIVVSASMTKSATRVCKSQNPS